MGCDNRVGWRQGD